MKLNRLCIILPPDLIHLHKPHPGPSQDRHHHNRAGSSLRGQVFAFLGNSIRRLYYKNWVGCYYCNRQEKQYSGVFQDLEGVQISEKVRGENPRIFSYAELYIGSNGFSEEEVIGSGGFGKVYRAVLPSDGTVVAVKCLAEKGEKFEKTFAAELVAVAHLRHRNLVRLRGWCVHEDELLLVYDYMPNLSLDRVLFRRPENPTAEPLDWGRRRNIIGGLAAALHYLHEQLETQIIHRDVKTSNVMLDSNYNARLGDFGLARWLEHELKYQTRMPSMRNRQFRLAESSRIGGTIGYLPPESFQKRSVATAKADVFSFGIVVLEVVSGRRAVDLTYPDEHIILLDWVRRLSDEGKLLQAGDSRLQDGSYALYEMERLIHLGLLCTLHSPQFRPNMKWVVEVLSGNISGKLPPLPSFQAHPRYISLSSSSDNTSSSNSNTTTMSTPSTRSSSTTVTVTSSAFVTAIGETIYATADFGHNDSASSKTRSSQQRSTHFMVETPRQFSYKEIISATHNFSDSHRISEVDFGTAYYGDLEDSHQVLVKRLGMTQCPALQTRFSNELENLAKLRHRNLIQLRGWCTEHGEMLVVYDYSKNRLLSHLLFHHDNRIGHSVLHWHHRYNIIRSLAAAILYLHEEWDEQVIHRNITSSSVIIDSDMNPRLGNFALAEFLSRNDQAHKAAKMGDKSVRGIFGYMSPEYIESGEATPMGDVYSFGVVLLEVVTGQLAVDFRRPDVLLVNRINEFEAQKRPVEELVDIRLDGEHDHDQLMRILKLGITCTRSNPDLRPTMRQIVSILDGNDDYFMKTEQKTETREEWKRNYAPCLSLIKRVQALGIQ